MCNLVDIPRLETKKRKQLIKVMLVSGCAYLFTIHLTSQWAYFSNEVKAILKQCNTITILYAITFSICSIIFIKLGSQININYTFSKSKLIIQQSFPNIYSEFVIQRCPCIYHYVFMSDPDFLLFAVTSPWFLSLNS